jgi:hypothetical protein
LLLGFDVTLQLDLSTVPENWEELVKKCGLLKRNCFAAVFEKYFDFQVQLRTERPKEAYLTFLLLGAMSPFLHVGGSQTRVDSVITNPRNYA